MVIRDKRNQWQMVFNFRRNYFLFLQHDLQHDSSWIEFDSSLFCVENLVLKLEFHFEANTPFDSCWKISVAVNNDVHIGQWHGNPCIEYKGIPK